MAFLSLAFAACALMIAGLPPLSGFVAKFSMFHALLNPEAGSGAIGATGWTLMALVLVSGLIAVISMLRFGVRTFWAAEMVTPPRLHLSEVAPVTALLLLSLAMTVQARPLFDYLGRASADLHDPGRYTRQVLPGPVVSKSGETP
jgi:multicomponent K+:H+ antiporter subunit D